MDIYDRGYELTMKKRKYIYQTVLIFFSISIFTLVVAEETKLIREKRFEALPPELIKRFEAIQVAFEKNDYNKVDQLLRELESDELKVSHGKNKKINDFHQSLSKKNLVKAKNIADELVESSEMSDANKAYIHNALGNAYFANGNLDAALVEFKKILGLRK